MEKVEPMYLTVLGIWGMPQIGFRVFLESKTSIVINYLGQNP